MNFIESIEDALAAKANNQKLLAQFFSPAFDSERYVVGKNEQSIELIERFQINGVIDDFSGDKTKWSGIPLFKIQDVPKDSIVVNCATSISPVEVTKNLKASGIHNILGIHELIGDNNHSINYPWFVSQQREEISRNSRFWSDLYDRLSDEESRQILLDVTRYRLTANQCYMNDYEVRLKDQYFEDFMAYSREIFVDAGGFDGDTTEEFVSRYPDYQKIIFFEPSQKNIDAARMRLSCTRNIEFRQVGLSNSVGTLAFNADAGSASCVTNGDGQSIEVVTLDEALNQEPVSFIKMDLEGWELKALQGATETIMANKPKLAIAVYHAAKDFRVIPDFLLEINPNYRIYLRHYTQGWSETVMYFI